VPLQPTNQADNVIIFTDVSGRQPAGLLINQLVVIKAKLLDVDQKIA
jgi:hypothetical protein